ncbi:MAG: aminotransferase class I/II-fold pyridoxal phosphate-dependent enzyme [Saprospiraceae bacterium]|nr:aminotransferase class I/II-fold pyridoxal phosphate-dependent enzyme [Saprospiraceae bacterium]
MIISPSNRLDDVTTYYFVRKLEEIDAMNKDGGSLVLNLGIGSPDLLPPQIVMDTLTKSLGAADAHKYQSYKGILQLRNGFANWYKNQFGVHIDQKTQVLPLIGSKEGVMHISMSFLNEGDEVLIPNPGYPSYAICTKLAGGIPVDMPLEESLDWKPDLKKLAQTDLSKVKLMWINYPNMPTGATADLVFFEDLVAFAKQHKILICHDNPYTFILNDQPLSIFNVPGSQDCSIELVSLSKCYNMAGWRVGAVIGAREYIDTIMTFKSNMDSGMFKPIQEASAAALELGQDWIKNLNEVYKERKVAACNIMAALRCSYDETGAGMFIWGKIPMELKDSDAFSDQLLKDTRVFITPGHIFGSKGLRFLRVSLCSSAEDMKAALYRIKTGFNMNDYVLNDHNNHNITRV